MNFIIRATLPAALLVVSTAVPDHASGQPLADMVLQVDNTCLLDSPGGWILDFGSYDALSAESLRADTVFHVRCTAGTAFRVTMNPGDHFQGDSRHMAHTEGEALVPYALRFGGHQGMLWTESNYPEPTESAGASIVYEFQVFGEVASGVDASIGRYADTVIVSVELQ